MSSFIDTAKDFRPSVISSGNIFMRWAVAAIMLVLCYTDSNTALALKLIYDKWTHWKKYDSTIYIIILCTIINRESNIYNNLIIVW